MSLLEYNLPFLEKIGGQEYTNYDTVSCISTIGNEYKGTLLKVDNGSYIMIGAHDKRTEFKYYSVNPTRIVLVEKIQDYEVFYYEISTMEAERDFYNLVNDKKVKE